MTQSSWPSPDNTRIISDVQYEELVASYAAEGLVGAPGDGSGLFADSTGKQVKVKAGTLAHLRGHGWTTDTDLILTVTDNTSGLTRYDRAVLRLDRSTWNVTAAVKAGTPGAGTPPAVQRDLGSSGQYEMPLGSFPAPSGFTSIAGTAVTPEAWYLAAGGGIACTSVSRPPHAAGRRIYETDTARTYMSTGTTWLLTGEDTGWVNVTIGNSADWYATTSPLPAVRRINGVVHLRGGDIGVNRNMGAGHSGPNWAMFSIPDGFRSTVPFYWSARSGNNLPLQLSMRTGSSAGLASLTGYDTAQPLPVGVHIFVDNTSWPL